MKTFSRSIFLILSVTLITSCSPPPPEPTPTSTATLEPTPIPPTDTPEPSLTSTPTRRPTATQLPPTPTDISFLPQPPSGTPLSKWHDIPIMPDALNGEERGADTYIFTIQTAPEDVERFYTNELVKLGWTLLGIGKGETGGNALMIFAGPKGTLTVSILIADEKESLIYVMIIET